MAFVSFTGVANLRTALTTGVSKRGRSAGGAVNGNGNGNGNIRCSATTPRHISRRELGKRILQIGLATGIGASLDVTNYNYNHTHGTHGTHGISAANAVSGLKIFPLTEQLGNNYYLMRAGESKSDARGEAKSNPIDMMSIRERGLTRSGIDEIRCAAAALRSKGVEFDAWLWPAIATNSMETAEVLAYELNIRRERVVPEFSFLDARGLGKLDGMDQKHVNMSLREMDRIDTNNKPDPNTDGTPNESVEQVFVKLRQLISKLETQYFGENIILIAPDSQTLSILQATLLDADLNHHHDMEFNPGEIRRVEGKVINPIDGNVTTKGTVEVLHKARKI